MNIPTRNRTSSAGFTLLELTIVLGILAVVTHLAIVEAAKYRTRNLRRTAEAQLAEVRKAVLGANLDCADGFVADMGRLPLSRAVAKPERGGGTAAVDAGELWARGNLPPYAVLSAVTNSRASGSAASDAMDRDVRLACGWRGPYLRLPPGRDRLRDPWGNAFESPDAAGAQGRLLGAASNVVTAAGQTIAALAHFGADGLPDSTKAPADAEAADSALFFAAARGTLTVRVEAVDAAGAAEPLDQLSAGGSFVVRLYGAEVEGAVAKIRVDEATVALATNMTANAFSVTFTDVAPGPHAIVVKHSSTGRLWTLERVVLPPLSEGSGDFPPVDFRLVIPRTLLGTASVSPRRSFTSGRT